MTSVDECMQARIKHARSFYLDDFDCKVGTYQWPIQLMLPTKIKRLYSSNKKEFPY